jgi:hypothetical protein
MWVSGLAIYCNGRSYVVEQDVLCTRYLSGEPTVWCESTVLNLRNQIPILRPLNPMRKVALVAYSSGNYMYHLLFKSVALHFVCICFVWCSE